MDNTPLADTMQQSPQWLMQEAQRHEAAGDLPMALEFYNSAIALSPSDGRPYFLRGNLQLEMGHPADAAESYAAALTIKPDSAGAHFNLGNARRALGQKEAQIIAYRRAIALKPDFVDAHIALSLALEERGDRDGAEAHLRQALLAEPTAPGALFNLGSLLAECGRHDEATGCLQQAITARPDYVEAHILLSAIATINGDDPAAAAHLTQVQALGVPPAEAGNNLGTRLKKLGHPELAVACYQQTLQEYPDNAALLNNLGIALKGQGQLEEAQDCFLRSLALDPEFSPAYLNLGVLHFMFEDYQQAIENCRKALTLTPSLYDAANNLGAAYQRLGMFSQARDNFQRAIDIDPSHADAYNNLGNVLSDLGIHGQASANYRKALELKPDYFVAFSNLLFTQNYSVDGSPQQLYEEALEFGRRVRQRTTPFISWLSPGRGSQTLRVGFVSGDLAQHPVGFFLESILDAMAKRTQGRFEFFCYHNNWRVDPLTERLKAHCQHWETIYSWSDKQVAERIHADGVDILIDLSGHTGKNRLPVFAWKPAPLQISWLGYFATTGVAEIDCLIADPWTLPVDEERFFSEQIIRLPHTRLCFTEPRETTVIAPLPALRNGFITFGSQNNLSKLTDKVVAIWSKILLAIPDSRMLIKARQLEEASVRKDLLARFTRLGVAAERFIMEPPSDRRGYFATYNRIDIALDPFPYPGGTTTVEALWMGVPVLTLAGKRFLGRQGVGLLQNAGLPEWIANSSDEYLNLAISHASDWGRLARLRKSLRESLLTSPIFDAADFAYHFEKLLRDTWQKWCNSQQKTTTTHARPIS